MKKEIKLTKKEQAALDEAALLQQKRDKRRIRSYSADTWKKIESWGRETNHLSQHLQNYCFTIAGRVRRNSELEALEVSNGVRVLDLVGEFSPDLIAVDEQALKIGQVEKLEVTIEVLAQAVQWDKKNKILKSVSHAFMLDLVKGLRPLSEQSKKIASWNLEIIQKCGFEYKHVVVNKPVMEEVLA